MEHNLTLTADKGGLMPAKITLNCSCGEALLTREGSVSYNEVAAAVFSHTRPEIEHAVTEMLKSVSVKDIFAALMKKRHS